jgi:hypothetical protein
MNVPRGRRVSAGGPSGTEGGPGGDPQISTSRRVRTFDDPFSVTLTFRPSLFPQLIVLTMAAVPIVPHDRCPSMLTSCSAARAVLCCAHAPTGPAVYPVVHDHLPRHAGDPKLSVQEPCGRSTAWDLFCGIRRLKVDRPPRIRLVISVRARAYRIGAVRVAVDSPVRHAAISC